MDGNDLDDPNDCKLETEAENWSSKVAHGF
jgi:hypothetical protein